MTKFKVARLEEGKWVIYFPSTVLDLWLGQQTNYSSMQKELDHFNKGELKFLQFTGLWDCEGTEVYEGDIIESFDSQGCSVKHLVVYDNSEAMFKTMHLPIIRFNESERAIMSPVGCLRHSWIIEFNKKVIGNTLQNEKLLEG